MTLHNTTKYAFRYPDLAQAADLAFLLQTLAQDVDAKVSGFTEGIFSTRPAAGVAGKFFFATDTGVLYIDDGAAWHTVGFIADGSITLAKLASNSVDSSKIVDGTIVTADVANLAITSAKQAAGAGRAEDYGYTFPTTGLYNGYRFTLFYSDPQGYWRCGDYIYRADLDGTYPWHAAGNGPEFLFVADANYAVATDYWSAVAGWAGPPRSGHYFFDMQVASGSDSSGSNAPIPMISIFAGGAQTNLIRTIVNVNGYPYGVGGAVSANRLCSASQGVQIWMITSTQSPANTGYAYGVSLYCRAIKVI